MTFLEWKYFDAYITEMGSLRSNIQFVNIESGNGLTPDMWWCVTLTNDYVVDWRIYAAADLRVKKELS